MDAPAALPDACVVIGERCNQQDDDCDGEVDEDWAAVLDTACSVGVGACSASGTIVCRSDGTDAECSATPALPAAELCGNDGVDDDCDGTADEDCECVPGAAQPCGSDEGACQLGTSTCTMAGVWGPCVDEVGPAVELCNDLDDDCDGEVDEALEESCVTGLLGPCAPGLTVCTAGVWSPCTALVAAQPEGCNDIDDDCDGLVDDEVIEVCGTDQGDCVAGSRMCDAGVWGTCDDTVGPVAEDCNGGDDDCDGLVDEGCACFDGTIQMCGTDVGECSSGTRVCTLGAWSTCVGSTGPAIETCNTLDDDCDGVVDEGCPAQIAVQFPWNGYNTGSAHTSATTVTNKPLRPTFRWYAASATSYRLQVDDSCDAVLFATCAFPSPEVDSTAASTQRTLSADLAVSLVTPVGQRYYWRVQGCNGTLCGPWSAVHYLNVGRLGDDVNGDGYSDALVAAPRNDTTAADAGRVYVYFGGPGTVVEVTADVTFDGEAAADQFGFAVGAAGDVNGDGFADLVVGAPLNDAAGSNAGRVYVYLGGSDVPFDTGADATIDGAVAQDSFGMAAAPAGDVDGDGFADLVVGAPFNDDGGLNAGRAYLISGGATLAAVPTPTPIMTGTPSDALGRAVAGAGDVNGDGLADVVVGAPYQDTFGTDEGAATVYLGRPLPLVEDLTGGTLIGEADYDSFGWAVASAGDVNRDGFSDLIVGAPNYDIVRENAGAAYVYLGGPGLAIEPTTDGPLTGTHRLGEEFGWSVASAGDTGGDGYAEVVVGEPYWDEFGPFEGHALQFRGGAGSAFDTTMDRQYIGESSWDAHVGFSVAPVEDANGDGYADVLIGAPAEGTMSSGRAYLYLGGPGLHQGVLHGETGSDRFGTSVAVSEEICRVRAPVGT